MTTFFSFICGTRYQRSKLKSVLESSSPSYSCRRLSLVRLYGGKSNVEKHPALFICNWKKRTSVGVNFPAQENNTLIPHNRLPRLPSDLERGLQNSSSPGLRVPNDYLLNKNLSANFPWSMIRDDGLYLSLSYILPLEFRENEPKEYCKASVSSEISDELNLTNWRQFFMRLSSYWSWISS